MYYYRRDENAHEKNRERRASAGPTWWEHRILAWVDCMYAAASTLAGTDEPAIMYALDNVCSCS
jgi:hypothetical protein